MISHPPGAILETAAHASPPELNQADAGAAGLAAPLVVTNRRPPKGRPFTRETAQAAARVSAAKRATLARLTKFIPPLPAHAQPADFYAAARLLRVRAQLDRLDSLLMKELDPLALDRLARAASALAEQERKLAGRPDPGQRRPGPDAAALAAAGRQPRGTMTLVEPLAPASLPAPLALPPGSSTAQE